MGGGAQANLEEADKRMLTDLAWVAAGLGGAWAYAVVALVLYLRTRGRQLDLVGQVTALLEPFTVVGGFASLALVLTPRHVNGGWGAAGIVVGVAGGVGALILVGLFGGEVVPNYFHAVRAMLWPVTWLVDAALRAGAVAGRCIGAVTLGSARLFVAGRSTATADRIREKERELGIGGDA